MRRRQRLIGTAICALGFLGAGTVAGAQGGAAAGKPALWRTYDMIVNLQNLPRTYTCDQLWYEFHGILLRLGAWPYSVSILPYHCSPSPGGDLKSPDVEVRFQLPFFLQGVAAQSAPSQAVERTVRLAPGEPKTLQTSDCQLLQQIDGTMLATIVAHVDAENFHCSAGPPKAADFSVTLTLPMAVKMPTLSTTSAPGPR
ncbi:MAG TPA: hypothetical protein VGR92_15045 [Steroidobacteraceae bacterium]|nr:hypothetical protein [Steroidobacteraceae bacterium]